MTAQRTKMGYLVINNKKQYLYKGLNPIGRNMDATIIIKGKEISIHHAMITIVDEENQFISDMKSSNGTFLGERHLSPLELFKLEDRAKIKFSNITAIYQKLDNTEICNIINTQTTESFTQTFFGAQTQIMENTGISDNNNTPDSENSNETTRKSSRINEIETQILNQNHISIHEMQTQMIQSDNSQPSIHEMQLEDFPITQRDHDILISEPNIREMDTETLPETQGHDDLTPKDELNELPTQPIGDRQGNGKETTQEQIEKPYEIVDEDSDGQSQLHTSQLRRLSRSNRMNSDDEKKEENVRVLRKRSINLNNVPQSSKTNIEAIPQTKSLEKIIEHEEKGYSDSSSTDIDEDKLKKRKKGKVRKKARISKTSSSEDSDVGLGRKKPLAVSDNQANVSSEQLVESRLEDDCSSRISTDLEDLENVRTERTQRIDKNESVSNVPVCISNINEENKSDLSTDVEENIKDKKNETKSFNKSVAFPIIEDDSSTDVEGNLKITKQLSISCISNLEESRIGWNTKNDNTIPCIEDDSSTDVEDNVKRTKKFSTSHISDFDDSYVKKRNVLDESEVIPETQQVFNNSFKSRQQKDNSYLDLSEIIPCTQDFSSEDFSLRMRGSSDEYKEKLECIEERTESGSVLEESSKESKTEENIKKGKEDDFVKSFLEDSNDSVDFLAATQMIMNSAVKPDSTLNKFSSGKRGNSAEDNDGLKGQEVDFEAPTQKINIITKGVEDDPDFFALTQKIFPQLVEFKKPSVNNVSLKDVPSTSKNSNLEICLKDLNSRDFEEDFYDPTQKVVWKPMMELKEKKLESQALDYDAPTQKVVFEPDINTFKNKFTKANTELAQTNKIDPCTSKISKICSFGSDSFDFEAATEKIDITGFNKNDAKEKIVDKVNDTNLDIDEDSNAPSSKHSDNHCENKGDSKNDDKAQKISSPNSNSDLKFCGDSQTQLFDFDIETQKIIEQNHLVNFNKSIATNQSSTEDTQTFDFDCPTQKIIQANTNKEIEEAKVPSTTNFEELKISSDLETQSFDFDAPTQRVITNVCEEINAKNMKSKEEMFPSASTSHLEQLKNPSETQAFDFNAPTQKITADNNNCFNEHKIEEKRKLKHLESCDFDAPTQKIFSEETKVYSQDIIVNNNINEEVSVKATIVRNLEEESNNLSDMETQTFDYDAPTQKIDTEQKLEQIEKVAEKSTFLNNDMKGDLENDLDFVHPTNKNLTSTRDENIKLREKSEQEGNSCESKNHSDDTDYSAPTQMILPIPPNNPNMDNSKNIPDNNEDLQEDAKSNCDDDDFSAPTQMILPIPPKDEDDVDYLAPTQIIDTGVRKNFTKEKPKVFDDDDYCVPTQKVVEVVDSDTDSVDYSVPTQKIFKEKNNSDKRNTKEDDVDYSAPTQKIIEQKDVCRKAGEDSEDEFDYCAPIQKIIEEKHKEKSKEDSEDDIDYAAPTQKIVEDKPGNSNKEKSNNDNFDYSAPTQKIIRDEDETDDENDDATQVIAINTEEGNSKNHVDNDDFDYLAPTQKIVQDKPTSLEEHQKEDFDFSAPTQKIFDDPSETTANLSNIFKEHSKDFASSTQKISVDTIFSEPTQNIESQKVPISILSPRNKSANSSPKKSVSFSQIQNVAIEKRDDIETQMEVIFDTQNVHLIPQDEERPNNPIADVLKDITTQDVVDILGEDGVCKKRTSEDSDEENDAKRQKLNNEKKKLKKSGSKSRKKTEEVEEPKKRRTTRSEKKVEEIAEKDILNDDLEKVEALEENKKKNVSNKRKSSRISEQPVRRSTRRSSVEEKESLKVPITKSTLNSILEEPSTSKFSKISCIPLDNLLSPSRKFMKLSMKKTIQDNDTDEDDLEDDVGKPLHIINLDDDVEECNNKKKVDSCKEEKLLKSRQTKNLIESKIDENCDVKEKEKIDDRSEEKKMNKFESKEGEKIGAGEIVPEENKTIDVNLKIQNVETERISGVEENVYKLSEDIEESIGERMKIRSRKKVEYKETLFDEFPKKTITQSKTLTNKNVTQKSLSAFKKTSERINIKVPKRQQQLVISDDEQLEKFVPILDVNTKKKRGRKAKAKEEEVVDAVASTSKESPKKVKKEEIDKDSLSTPKRNKRILKHKVVFTMCDDPELHTIIRYLGGSVVDSVDNCTVLVTNSVLRTQKLLTAVGQGKPICSPAWLHESKKMNKFLDPWENLISDPESEKKWDFSLQESFNRSRTTKLFQGYSFQLLINTAADVLKGAIESCGGKVVSRAAKSGEFLIVSSKDNESKYSKFAKKGLKVVAAESIFDGVLRQEIVFHKHYLT